jgi:flagellar biosynthesis protein FlhG
MQEHKGQTDTVERPGPRIFTVASGKGGVGKSCLTANLGALLARSGLRVLLIDGDTGLANLDIILGLAPEHRATLEQVIDGRARIQDAIVGVEPNLWLIPAASGLSEIRTSGPETRLRLLEIFEECPWEMDVILIDAGAGIGQNVLSLHSPAFESLIVLTPEPTSMTDAYSLIKLLRRHMGISRANVIVNQVTDGRQGLAIFQKLKEVAARFTDVELEYAGHCPRDEKITTSVMKRKILLDLDKDAPSVPCLELLAKRMLAKCQEIQVRETRVAHGWGSLTQDSVRNRFQDEPAQAAPGNTTKFWRTLLGEVRT